MIEDGSDDPADGAPCGGDVERRSGAERRIGDERRAEVDRRSGYDRRGSGLRSPPASPGDVRPYGFRSFDDRRAHADRRKDQDRRLPQDRRYAEPEVSLSTEELEALLGPSET